MSFRSFAMITVSLLVSLPTLMAQAEEKPSHHKANRGPASISALQPRQSGNKELNRIYQSLIRDSQKQLSPSVGDHSVYLPTSGSSVANRSLASDTNRRSIVINSHAYSSPAQHAAIPWAADVSASGGVFSVK
jgi:hypothetical protein